MDDETRAAVDALDAIEVGDPEGAHDQADNILLANVAPEIRDAYRRLVNRSPWWAAA